MGEFPAEVCILKVALALTEEVFAAGVLDVEFVCSEPIVSMVTLTSSRKVFTTRVSSIV
jgi:hypothetical protein